MASDESLIPSFWQFVVLLIIAAASGLSVILIKGIHRPVKTGKEPVNGGESIAKKETSIMIEGEETERPSIKIIREQYFFSYKNIRIAEVEHRLDIYRSKEKKFLAYYSEDYRSRFRAKLHDGTGLQIIPVWELPHILNEGLSAEQEKITRDGVVKQFSSVLGISEEEVYKVVAIILLPEHTEPTDTRQGYYEEIIVSWLDKRDLSITEKRERVERITVAVGGNASSYVDIQLAEKYQFESPPRPGTIEKNKQKKQVDKDEDYTTILDDRRHYIFRFRRGLSGQVIINFKIGLEKMLLTWIRLGSIIGSGTIVFSLFVAALYEEPFVLGTPIVLGSLAALVGFRILLFEDIDLLEKWSWIYIILIIANAAILAYIGGTEIIFHKTEQENVTGFFIGL